MRKKLSASIFLVLMIGTAAAMCPVVFTPPNSFVHLTSDTQGLISYDGETDTQRFVVRQAYEGVASDFGLVTPTPSEPVFTARDDEIFKQLNDLTKEPKDRVFNGGFSGAESLSADTGVRVVKERQVGDFNATVLRANSSEALVDWLNRNGFDYGERSEENFDYYIDKGGYYFTALKVNVEAANCLTSREFQLGKDPMFRSRIPDMGDDYNGSGECWIRGGLQPLEFEFESDKPVLPLRIMARNHDKSPMTPNSSLDGHEDHNHEHDSGGLPPGNFLLYTLSDQPLVVPGGKVKFSQRMSSVDKPLSRYNVSGKFLVRQRVKFNAHQVEEDLILKEAEPFYVSRESSAVINPSQVDESNGIIKMDGEARKVSLNPDPGFLAYTDYETAKLLTDLEHDLSSFLSAVAEALAVLQVIGRIMAVYPASFLMLVPPLVLGVLMKRRKALFHGSLMGYLGAFFAPLPFLLKAGSEQVMILLLGSFSLALVPALAYGVVGFISSTIASKVDRLKEYEGLLQGAELEMSSVVYSIAGLVSGSVIYVFRESVGESISAPSVAWLVCSLAGLFVIWKKFTDEVDVPENVRGDWKYFAVEVFVLMVVSTGFFVFLYMVSGPTV